MARQTESTVGVLIFAIVATFVLRSTEFKNLIGYNKNDREPPLVRAKLGGLDGDAARLRNDCNHPYKNAQVGDTNEYALTITQGSEQFRGSLVQSVTAKSATEITITVKGIIDGTAIPDQEQKIDLTRPLDLSQNFNLPGGGNAKFEKMEEREVKVQMLGKEYRCTRTSFKAKGTVMGEKIDAVLHTFQTAELSFGVLKLEGICDWGDSKMEMKVELVKVARK